MRPDRITVLGIDPGGTTGLSVVRWSSLAGWALLSTEEFPGAPSATITRAATLGHRFEGLKFIAAERFVEGHRSTRLARTAGSTKARAVLGGLYSLQWPVALAPAAHWKAWMTPARWEAIGFRFPPSTNHDDHRCAAGVAVYLMVKKGFAPDPLRR